MSPALDEVRGQLQQLTTHVEQLKTLSSAHASRVATQRAQLEGSLREVKILGECAVAFEVLLTKAGESSVLQIEQLITYGLRTVFPDLELSFKLIVDQKRGGLTIEPQLVDEKTGVMAPLLDAFGGGPAAVVSLLLRVMVCRHLKLAPVLLLDEPFSFVSAEYVERVAMLLRQLADQAGLTIVLVTHDRTYLRYATKGYQIQADGGQGSTFVEVDQ